MVIEVDCKTQERKTSEALAARKFEIQGQIATRGRRGPQLKTNKVI